MKKALLALILMTSIFANTADTGTTNGDDGQVNEPTPCLELTEEKLIALTANPENELVFKSNACSYADFSKELKEKLQSLLLGDEDNGRLQIALKDEQISVIMDTLATDHLGSSRFSFEDTKKVEDFYTSTRSDTFKQTANLDSIKDENTDSFFLVLLFNAEKDKLIVIYKRLTEIPVQPDEPTEP